MAFAADIFTLMIGRFTVGVALGISCMIMPVYLAEVAPNAIRGVCVTFYILALNIGQLISGVVAFELGRNWRLMLGIGAGPSVIQFFLILFLSESPRWLGKRYKSAERIKGSLLRLYNEEDAEVEYQSLLKEVEKMKPYLALSES